MNKIIKNVLVKLENEGYEAYIVGGYVRDSILRRKTYDIDICTNALPKEIYNLFGGKVYAEYGNCSFKIGKYNFDITTYRKDYKYINRKPTVVKYINSLVDDLQRRDFTVNVLCMNKNGKIFDYYNSKNDLQNQVIKIIGNADEKFIEDPLRILRAIRFAATLNFEIEESLKKDIVKNRILVKTLSKNRIKSELSKLFLSKNYAYAFELMKELRILEVLEIPYKKIKFSSDLLVMFTQINLDSTYFTKIENKQIKSIENILNYGKIDSAMLYRYGLYLCTVVGEVFGTNKNEVNKIYKNMWINERKPLNVTSNDIMVAMNINSGILVGEIIMEVEKLILEKKLANDRKKIIEYLKSRK